MNMCKSMDFIASTRVQFSWEHQLWKYKIHWLGRSINTTVLEPPTIFSSMVRLSSLGHFREVKSPTTKRSGPPTSSFRMILWPSGSKLLLKQLKLDVISGPKLNLKHQAKELCAAHLRSCWALSTLVRTARSPSGLQQKKYKTLGLPQHWTMHSKCWSTGSACPVAMAMHHRNRFSLMT